MHKYRWSLGVIRTMAILAFEKQHRSGTDVGIQDVSSIEAISLVEKTKLAQETAARIKIVKDMNEKRLANENAIMQQREAALQNDRDRNETMKEFINSIKSTAPTNDNNIVITALNTRVHNLEVALNNTQTDLAASRSENKIGFEQIMAALAAHK